MTTLPEKLTYTLATLVALIVVVIIGFYWLARIPPKRPSTVPTSAVFIWGLPVGLPTAPRGMWVDCWLDSDRNEDRCRVTSVKGDVTYEGVFLPYRRPTPLPERKLTIDASATNEDWADREVWVGETKLVPLVTLRNGEILIPKAAYESGTKKLDDLLKRNNR